MSRLTVILTHAVARVAAITFRKPADDSSLPISGIGRTEAMAYRDARGQGMRDADWDEVEAQLRAAYQRLRMGIGG